MLTPLLRRFLRPYARWLVVVLVLLLVQAMTSLYLPTLNARLIDEGVTQGDLHRVWTIGGWMLLVSAVLAVATVAGVYWSARTAMAVGRDMRAAVFLTVEGFSAREVNAFGTPSLITRNTNDVQQVQMVVLLGLTIMVLGPVTMVGGIVMALRQDVGLSAVLIVALPVMAGVIGLQVRRLLPLFRSMQVKIDTITSVLREQITGVRVVRAFVKEEHETARFADANADLTGTALQVTRVFALLMPMLMAVLNLSSVAIMWFGAHRVDDGALQIGQLTAFLSYMMQILLAVMMATMMVVMVPRAAACAERICAVLDTEPTVREPALPVLATPGLGVELVDVGFSYPGAERPVLSGVSFTLRPGATTAIVGSTGAGKTTLVNLLPRLYDVTEGRVLVGGVDVREQGLEALWASIALCPQKPFLFRGTVASNLRFGDPEATDDDLWRALEVAQARDFVEAMEGGLEAEIVQGGANLSGGQRQRLAIARAVVKRPAVYVFDDSFSALDYTTDARLRAALRECTRDAVVLVVAQRVSTVMHAERIVVLDEGRVVGIGTHDELLETCTTYEEIVSSQLAAAA